MDKEILKVEGVSLSYLQQNALWGAGKKRKQVLYDISFSMKAGEVLGLLGESGCGKSTLARVVAGLEKPEAGSVSITGGRPQMIFQDPYGSLNPVKRIGWIMEEPLRLRGGFTKQERKRRVLEMLNRVGLDEKLVLHFPRQLSGGQRQRVCIGVALMLEPDLLLADEAVSALDVTIQAQIIELLLKLKEEMGLSILFISHDMRVVHQMSDRVMVMKDGRIVESGETDQVYFSPTHPYTKSLLSAAGIVE